MQFLQLHRTATCALELAAGTSSKVSDQLDLRSEAKTSCSIFFAASDRTVILRTRICCSISFCFLTKTTSLALFTSFHNPILTRSNSGRKTKDEAMILKRGQHPVGFLADASSIDWSLGILGSSSFDYAGLEQMLAKSSILCFQNRRCEAVAFDCYNNLRFVSVSFYERCDFCVLPESLKKLFHFCFPAGGSGFSEDFHGILGSFCGKPGTTKHTGSLAWIDAHRGK